jgi:hypothetical protein
MIQQLPVKVKSFETVTWSEHFVVKNDEGQDVPRVQQIILIYALGEDGVVYEFSGGLWTGFPIESGRMREIPQKKKTNANQARHS